MKKSFTRLCVSALMSVLSVPAFAASVQIGQLFYDLDSDAKTAAVARNASYVEMTSVEIPSKVMYEDVEYTVVTVGQQAFQGCNMTSVVLPSELTTISAWAFWSCSNLTAVEIPATVTSVGKSAFSKCTSLTDVKFIGGDGRSTLVENNAFSSCTSLESVNLGSVSKMGAGVFMDCSKLATVTLSSVLTELGDNAFYGCAMTSVALPEGFTTLGRGVFSNCSKLEEVTLPSSLATIGEQTFYKCVALKNVNYSENLTAINGSAFYECVSLETLPLPNTLKFIGSSAFYGCSAVKKAVIPSEITELSGSVFYNCTSLTEVVLHEGVSSIGRSAFQGCSALESVTLPAGIKTLGIGVFSDCVSLTGIVLPEGLTTIGDNAFFGCEKLASLSIPASVTSFGNSVVRGCYALNSIDVASGNTVYESADGIMYTKGITRLCAYPAGRTGVYVMPNTVTEIPDGVFNANTNIEGIKFSENLKSIGLSAFYNCGKLTELVFPQSLESIGQTCFIMCRNLTKVVLPNRQVNIGSGAFMGTGITSLIIPEGMDSVGLVNGAAHPILSSCSSLKSVVLPSSLKSISPFGGYCGNLTNMYCFATVPPEVVTGSSAVTVSATMGVPEGCAAAYKEAWSAYSGLTFAEVLPGPASLTLDETSATLSWTAYSAEAFPATPVRYEVSLYDEADGGKLLKSTEIEASGSDMNYRFTDLSRQAYRCELKGFTANGEMTLRYDKSFNLAYTSVDEVAVNDVDGIEVSGNTVSVSAPARVYAVSGALVAVVSEEVTLPSGFYVVVIGDKAVKIRI